MFGDSFFASARKRLGSEQGFMAGSIMEVLIVIPILLLIVAAGLGFMVTSGRTEARSQKRYSDIEAAQRGLDKMARELRQASSIKYVAPTLPITGTGQTDTIVAHTVSKTFGGTPTDITYRCVHAPNAADGFAYDSFCISSLTTGGTAKAAFTVPTSGTLNGYLLSPDAGPRIYNSGGTASTVAAADLDNFAVFRFEYNGQPSLPASANSLKIRLVVCVADQTCSKAGSNQPVVLEADVTPRNATGGLGN